MHKKVLLVLIATALVLTLGLSISFSRDNDSDLDEQEIIQKLDRILDNQEQILKELEIIKVRASR